MTLTRRQVLAAMGVAAGAAAGQACGWFGTTGERDCSSLRGRRVRWLVPGAAGGSFDAESRAILDALSKRLDATVELERHRDDRRFGAARAISAAAPDGLTLGLVSASALLMALGDGRSEVPNPVSDLTVLGRVGRTRQLWTAGPRAGGASLDELATISAKRPLVFGVPQAPGPYLIAIAVGASLLGWRVELARGFRTARNAVDAAVRGEVDLVCSSMSAVRAAIRSGGMRPVLQIAPRPMGGDPSLAAAAVLGGPSGAAAARARALGRDAAEAVRLTDSLDRVVSGGRLIVAPPRMPDALSVCLSDALQAVLTQDVRPALRARLDPAPADAARAEVSLAVQEVPALIAMTRPLIESRRRQT